jgi:hypothetical protein
MTTFRIDATEGPGTHVFIVGVGTYPHLKDGEGQLTPQPMGMGQLTSPPLSALRVLDWVDKELNNPAAPLKSVEVLVSQPVPATYTDKAGLTSQIDGATFANFEQSAKAWFDRASGDPKNVAIFYFCGHGLGDGLNTQLLLSDYGSSNRPLRHAINFSAFRLAMGACNASKQLFLLDACRVIDPTMLFDPFNMGDSGLPPGNVTKMPMHIANPVIYSAKIGKQAFGPKQGISYFTDALLHGLSRCGVYFSKGSKWAVSPNQLQTAIASLLDDFSGNPHCPADGIVGTGFEIHVLDKPPEVIVVVTLNPATGNAEAKIKATCSGVEYVRRSQEHPWRTFLPFGQCSVDAKFPESSQYRAIPKSLPLYPPWQEIELEVV